jgi:hypothetical protein
MSVGLDDRSSAVLVRKGGRLILAEQDGAMKHARRIEFMIGGAFRCNYYLCFIPRRLHFTFKFNTQTLDTVALAFVN